MKSVESVCMLMKTFYDLDVLYIWSTKGMNFQIYGSTKVNIRTLKFLQVNRIHRSEPKHPKTHKKNQ